MRETRRNPRLLVQSFTPVMKLVYLAMQMDAQDIETLRAELLSARIRAYEDEITILVDSIGCDRKGKLSNNSIINDLNDMSKDDSDGIVNTYNYDLAAAIVAIKAENPRSNRHVYASRLLKWSKERTKWKSAQIAEYTDGTARSRAQQDFIKYNSVDGVCVLTPETAVCPVCQGWINRGEVQMTIAMNYPPPYHPGCVHTWLPIPDKQVSKYDCGDLWIGGE